MAQIEKTNVVQQPENPVEVGKTIEITNPIEQPVVVYSDAPGAGPEGSPNAPKKGQAVKAAPAAEDAEAEVDAEPKAKAVDAPPSTKAVAASKAK